MGHWIINGYYYMVIVIHLCHQSVILHVYNEVNCRLFFHWEFVLLHFRLTFDRICNGRIEGM